MWRKSDSSLLVRLEDSWSNAAFGGCLTRSHFVIFLLFITVSSNAMTMQGDYFSAGSFWIRWNSLTMKMES